MSIAERGTSGARRKEVKRRFVRDETDRWLAQRGVTLIGADLDESPMAYRRLPQAGEGEFDPWKGCRFPEPKPSPMLLIRVNQASLVFG